MDQLSLLGDRGKPSMVSEAGGTEGASTSMGPACASRQGASSVERPKREEAKF